MIMTTTDVNLEVFRRYAGLSLPRHVSYPMPTWWHEVDAADVSAMYGQCMGKAVVNDLSLYLHVPFCENLCRFCACTRITRRKDSPAVLEQLEAYVGALEHEIVRLADALAGARRLRQIHWGGGSPTYLSMDQMAHIQRTIQKVFDLASEGELAIELDPRRAAPERLRHLRGLGFNRVSLGVQDFNEQVQKHVRRVQPLEMIRDVVASCREVGFNSINFDLIYGLPYQTVESVCATVEQTIGLSPDRVAYYHYAQIPEKIATQRGMDYAKLPDSETKLAMFIQGASLFQSAGYEFVGLDHFAKPDELLGEALKDGTVQRNFQGMTTGGGLDLIGVGSSSISQLLGIGFTQNTREVDAYIACIERGASPINRGKRFTEDDRIRQTVLSQLYCMTEIDPGAIEKRFGLKFSEYFGRELEVLKELEGDGLVTLDADDVIRVTYPLGRVLLRNIAAVFDAYLHPDAYRVGEQACFSANA